MRWRILLEEYSPEIVYIKVIHNTVADAVSRLEFCPSTIKPLENNYIMLMVWQKC